MSQSNKRQRSTDRAIRLRTEASNCVSIALRKQQTNDAAELIDEAVRLATRSRELLAGDAPEGSPRDPGRSSRDLCETP